MMRPPTTAGRATWGIALFLTALTGCSADKTTGEAPKAPAPAKVELPKESNQATVTLQPEAETRLGLALVRVTRQALPRTVCYAGDVIVPPGRLASVSSPFVGSLKGPDGGRVPAPGERVSAGQPMFVLVPILSPEARATMAPLLIEAEGQVKQAVEQLNIARVALDRAENLVRDRLGGSAAVVDAKAQFDLAQTTLKAAENRRDILAKVASDSQSGSVDAQSQTIASPSAGIVQNLHAQAGQKVAAGALLFDVASLDSVWVRVPVYVGDLDKIATEHEAAVGGLSETPGAPRRTARPVTAPPSGDPLAATVNLFYAVDNTDGGLRPGQRVGVVLPLRGEQESLVVPRAALLRDIQGDTWVYENTAPHAYARRRVSVDRIVGDLAALASGPKLNAQVVTDGAAELFGAEFGLFK